MSALANELLTAPTSTAAEWAVLSQMLSRQEAIAEVIGVPLEQQDFSSPDTRLVYATTVERHFAGKPVDAVIVAELARDELTQYWNAEPSHIGALLQQRVLGAMSGENLAEHAQIVKQLSTKRKIMEIAYRALTAIGEGKLSPEEIGDRLATDSLQATAGAVRRSELMSWMDKGRAGVVQLQKVIAARQQGNEVGVYTGLPFVDKHTHGIAPGELCFIASEPGAGKTALAWASALGFAGRQMPRTPRVGTLVLSMEMGLYSSFTRTVQSLTGIDGVRLREGDIGKPEYQKILREWKNREDLPVYWNFAPTFRLSQMRALIAEAIRKYNVGFVVIDHFRMVETDRRVQNANEADEAKVAFIKQNIARDFDVAVMCLAHTSKIRERGMEGARPRLSDLRGSGMISAFADFVALLWCPYRYMTEKQRAENPFVTEPDMEIDWSKNRFGASSVDEYTFLADTMRVVPRV